LPPKKLKIRAGNGKEGFFDRIDVYRDCFAVIQGKKLPSDILANAANSPLPGGDNTIMAAVFAAGFFIAALVVEIGFEHMIILAYYAAFTFLSLHVH
jgi:hypothetical protein